MKKLYLTTAAILLAVPAAFATSDVEAVTVIKTENGPVRIPLSQFNAAEHTLHVADEHHDEHGISRNHQSNNPAPVTSATPILDTISAQIVANSAPVSAPITPPIMQYGVLQNKGRFYIVNQPDGTPVDLPAINPKGYLSNKDAWEAMVILQTAPPAAS